MKRFLKKFPFLYSLVQRMYYTAFSIVELLGGTRIQEFRWKIRHLIRGKKWARGYRDTLRHPHRAFLIEKILAYQAIQTIMEVGCNAGPNLILLHEKLPRASLTGIDINRVAVGEGKQWLAELRITNIRIDVGYADDFAGFQDKSIDCIFTDATLMYIGPDKIQKVLSEFLRVATQHIVLLEYHADNPIQKTKLGFSYDGHWVYNYRNLFANYQEVKKITVTKLPSELWQDSPGWNRYGNLIEISL